MFYWMGWTLMACYVVRDDRAYPRFYFFSGLVLFLAVSLGMKERGIGTYQGYTRLTLEGQNVATMFANSNELAYLSCVIAIAFLFYSLRSKKLTTFFCVTVAIALAAVVVKTVSREGLILLVLGLSLYSVAVFVRRRKKPDSSYWL